MSKCVAYNVYDGLILWNFSFFQYPSHNIYMFMIQLALNCVSLTFPFSKSKERGKYFEVLRFLYDQLKSLRGIRGCALFLKLNFKKSVATREA